MSKITIGDLKAPPKEMSKSDMKGIFGGNFTVFSGKKNLQFIPGRPGGPALITMSGISGGAGHTMIPGRPGGPAIHF